jgi:predicted transcriptional regulator
MHLWVDFSNETAECLDEMSRARKIPREDLVRCAVAEYLAKHRAFNAAFGMWAKRAEDGIAYQQRMRSEWD